ncbi:hypothetical protein ACMXYX_09505 [Neptuniibacter sp. QD72_48]|uniref:hypothetical protein n=1 Tax=unclassified Neptuniibacter TaxID=2630693 RepID=UPI0039F46BE4
MNQTVRTLVVPYLIDAGFLPDSSATNDASVEHAVIAALTTQVGKISSNWQQWSIQRMEVAYLQSVCHQHRIDAGVIDGLYGPQTDYAVERLIQLQEQGSLRRSFADISPSNSNPDNFPLENESDLTHYYGEPGQVPLAKATCPWELRLDWNLNQTTRSISIHESLKDNLESVLTQVHDHYGPAGIREYGLDRYGGSYNPRKKRGSVSAWSTHAWGIALDWFPSQNKLRWRSDRASLAKEELDPWWDIWESHGWLSLGRSEDRDWMHVQAAKRG